MFSPFVSSPYWTYLTFPQRFLLIQLKPKHVFRHDARGAVFRDTLTNPRARATFIEKSALWR